MSLHRTLGVITVLLMTVPLMAQSLDFTENWDDQTLNQPAGDPWYNDPHYGASFWVEDAGEQRSAPYSLLVNNMGFNGRDLGSQALLDEGAEWNGSDDYPLTVEYYVWSHTTQRRRADYYVEISLGDVHAPSLINLPVDTSLPFPIPVLAYCKPFFEKVTMHYFDGQKWAAVGFHDVGSDWEQMTMEVLTDTVTLSSTNDGPYTGVARAYVGEFDRISIRTVDYTQSLWTSIDDVSVTGGYPAGLIVGTLDILPDDDPNYFTPKKRANKSRIPMAILGSAELDVTTIEYATVNIAGTVFPVKDRPSIEDENGDGYDDLKLHFARYDLQTALGLDLLEPGDMVDVTVNAKLGDNDLVATDTLVIKD